MEESLKHKTANSLKWVTIDIIGDRLLQFIIGVILARLLMPAEFGILGLIAVFIAFSMVFIDSGFSFALIRKITVAEIEYCTVFWFNVSVSIVCYILLWIFSPYIAGFFNQQLLKPVIKVISLSLIINAIGSIQYVNLQRKMQFKELAIVGIVSKIISGTLALIMAYRGFGVWSLVAQQVSMNVTRVLMMMLYNKFIPVISFSKNAFSELFAFSSKLLYGSILNSFVSNIYPLAIGKFFSVSNVGFFNRARHLQELPVRTFTTIIQKVTLPSFSKIQDEESRFKSAYQKAMKMSVFTIALPLIIIIVAAYPMINFLLTSKWFPAAHMLRVLAIGGIFYPLSALNVNIIGIKGRSDLVMYLQFIKDGLSIVALLIGMIWGINGLVWSFAITGIVSYFLNAYFANKVIDYPVIEQIKDVIPIFIIMLISGLTGQFFMSFSLADVWKIFIVTVCISVSYIMLAIILRLNVLTDTIDLVKIIIKKI